MIGKKLFTGRLVLVTLAVLALVWLTRSTSLAAQPENDNFVDATPIDGLPYSSTVDITEATIETDEPQACSSPPQTVWYSFTPGANAVVKVDMEGSSFYSSLVLYQTVGSGFGGLNFLDCTSASGSITFNVQAGVTYYLQAGNLYGGGGTLQLNLQEVPPPPNDNFSNATEITVLPFDDTVDTVVATTEAGEPTPSCAGSLSRTVWYAFTPQSGGSLSVNFNGPDMTALAVYTGSSLANLIEVSCINSFGLTFPATAGEIYYFQTINFSQGGSSHFHLEVTPLPVVSFSFYPGDPSVFDNIGFSDQSYDPGGLGFQSQAWDFGDGATATGCCPTHQYGADGDYTVQLTVTTIDGRTDSNSQMVQVRTHDVAITKLTAPNSASSGQTRQISVGVNSKRSAENVEVQLFKSVPGGFQQIGALTQSVPVRSANRTTAFDFSYTFTSDDAKVGKVTFKAVANLIGARDVLPADNEAIASPTKVSR